MLSFKNCNIYVNNKKIIKTDLTINSDHFSSFKANSKAITLNNKYIIVPGFIEEHIHGAMGCDTMDCKVSSLHTIAKSLLQDGVTSWLPTTMTMPKKTIIKALKTINNTKFNGKEAKIAGINLEGPFINKEKKGAQDEKYILLPNNKDLNDFCKASNNKIKITTVAIEKANKKFFDACKKNKVVVSIGHSMANGHDIDRSINYGLGCATHTFNAMDKKFEKGHCISSLLKSNIYLELILDLFHVPSKIAAKIFKNNENRIILITDSMSGRYMPDGEYMLGTNLVHVYKGKALLNSGNKAGSILRLSKALKNVKKVAKLSIEKTIDLVSKNPASNLGLKNIGSIKIGNWADFVIIDKNFNIYQTYVNGKLIYENK